MTRSLTLFLYRFLLAAFVCLPARAGVTEDITIRLINSKDGHPVQGQLIVIFLGDAKLSSTPRVRATTSSEGIAVVHLPEMIPKQVSLDVGNGQLKGCAWPFFSTEEVMKHGVVAENECDSREKLRKMFTAKPGEVIVFVRFLKWWEKMQT